MWNNVEAGLPVVKEMSFKYISDLQLVQPSCLMKLNHLENFGRETL